MRSLIAKIFLCYWIAASVVMLAIDLNPHEQMHRPEVTAALASILKVHGLALANAFEAGGCSAAAPFLSSSEDAINLASPDGTILCAPAPAASLNALIQAAAHSKKPVGHNFRDFEVIGLAVKSQSGKPYVVLLRNRFTAAIYFGVVPGTTTLMISLVVTLLLGLLIALPIRKLRAAARDIAGGRLDARVKPGFMLGAIGRFTPSDILRGLIVDFNHMAERLQSLVDAQRILVRDISHELRSPLARLSVALELAREAPPEAMSAPLDRIEAEAGRVNQLIGQLLSLSHLESLKEFSPTSALSLAEVVASVVPDVQYEASARECRVVTRVLHDSAIYGDPVLLQRALENIIRNAIRYTPESGIIEIDVERIERDGAAFAAVRVTDSGPGVPPDELESILRPFYRVDKARQRSTGGFGIGLAIADRAVKLHSGQIKASNKPEGGLVVEMIFPLGIGSVSPHTQPGIRPA